MDMPLSNLYILSSINLNDREYVPGSKNILCVHKCFMIYKFHILNIKIFQQQLNC